MRRLYLNQGFVDVGRGRSAFALRRDELGIRREFDRGGRAGLHHFQAAVPQGALDLGRIGLARRGGLGYGLLGSGFHRSRGSWQLACFDRRMFHWRMRWLGQALLRRRLQGGKLGGCGGH